MKCIKKELKYPLFLKVSHHHSDVYWQCVFEDMAYDICPMGVYIDSTTFSVHCNLKGKQFNYKFINKPVDHIYNDLIHLFKTHLNMFSKNDYIKSRTALSDQLKVKFESWKDIKKKSIKDILLENFILSLRSRIECSYIQLKKLLSIIHMAVNFKVITNNDVIIDPNENKIIDIIGFNLDQLTKTSFLVEMNSIPKIDKSAEFTKTDMMLLWKKFIKIEE